MYCGLMTSLAPPLIIIRFAKTTQIMYHIRYILYYFYNNIRGYAPIFRQRSIRHR